MQVKLRVPEFSSSIRKEQKKNISLHSLPLKTVYEVSSNSKGLVSFFKKKALINIISVFYQA